MFINYILMSLIYILMSLMYILMSLIYIFVFLIYLHVNNLAACLPWPRRAAGGVVSEHVRS